MVQYPKDDAKILSLFSYINSQYMIKSLLFRKQPIVETFDNNAMITWGPSLIIGGAFSNKLFKLLITKIKNSKFSVYIYLPKSEWESAVEKEFGNTLITKHINLYQHQNPDIVHFREVLPGIVPITADWLKHSIKNAQLVKDELYSYISDDDFLQNGFGLALVIDDVVCGYCLSEYSIDNECAINIWVDENYRGIGYAKMMTELFLQHSKNKNWNVFWGCTSDNLPSNKVAQSTGFIIHSTQKYFKYKMF
jgi:RimJ/RimL family protein N-acetyltransferase